jgi:hypothetical protein
LLASWKTTILVCVLPRHPSVTEFSQATLPHDKYYNMEAYEKNMSALRAGEFVPPQDDAYDPAADMRAHQSRLKKQAVEQESYLTKEQLEELRQVQRERNTVRSLGAFLGHCTTHPPIRL